MFVQPLDTERQLADCKYEIFFQIRITARRMAQLMPCFISQHHRQYHEPC